MYSQQEENELLRQARQGDKAACEQLLVAYEGLLKNMSRRYQYTPTGKSSPMMP
jgi:DNA-directed RNA polymerase specialized sigma subunit